MSSSKGRRGSQGDRMLVRRFSQIYLDERRESVLAHAVCITEEFQQDEDDENDENDEGFAETQTPTKDPENKATARIYAEFEEAWKELEKQISPEDTAFLNKKPADFKMIEEAVSMWEEKFLTKEDVAYVAAKGGFSRFCEAISAYSLLFSWIPVEDKYLKIFCSAVTIVVKAAENRGNIAEGFSTALAEIGENMKYWRDRINAYDADHTVASVDQLRLIVVRLYTSVFKFMVPCMGWSQSRWQRFKGSITNDYYDKNIKGPLDSIRRLQSKLKQEAGNQDTRVLVHVEDTVYNLSRASSRVQGLLASFATATQAAFDRQARVESEHAQMFQRRFDQQDSNMQGLETRVSELTKALAIGQRGTALLNANNEATTYKLTESSRNINTSLDTTKAQPLAQIFSPTPSFQSRQQEYTFALIEESTRHLAVIETGFSVEDTFPTLEIANELLVELQEWTSASESRTLWIYGPVEAIPSELSLTASYVVSTVNRLKIPVIAHSCPYQAATLESFMLVSYSIVRQLIWLLPDRFKSDIDFGTDRFRELTGNIKSIPDALFLIEDLLTVMPQLVVFVIDGFQYLDQEKETGDNSVYLTFLLETLKAAQYKMALKILITTDGFSQRLSQLLDADEQLDAMHLGRRKTGRSAVSEISFANHSDSEGSKD